MSYPVSIFRTYFNKLTLFSAIIFLLFIQLFVVQNLWAMDSQAISPYKQLMTERNLRLKKLQQFKGDRYYLKGAVGDAINIVMVAAGHNLRKILNKLRLLWLKIMFGLIRNFISLGKTTG